MTNFLPLIHLDGPVEIDETFIGSKQKSSHGRLPKKHHTVFGNLNK